MRYFPFLPLIGMLLSPLPVQAAGPTHRPTVVTSTSSTVLPANPGRRFLSIHNFSDIAVYCTVDGSSAAADTGYLIEKNALIVWDVEASVPKGAIHCIHAGTGEKAIVATE